MERFRLILVFGFCLFVISPTFAAPLVITVGTNYLAPDTANQVIPIYVSGGDLVQNINFTAEIGGGVEGPSFTGLDITSSGMVFSGVPVSSTSLYGPDDLVYRYAYATADFSPSSVPAGTEDPLPDGNQLLANLTVSTVGLLSGTFDLKLIGINDEWGLDTDFGSVPVTITNGTIEIQGEEVPEPASILLMAGLMACGAPALVLHRRRKRAAGAAAS